MNCETMADSVDSAQQLFASDHQNDFTIIIGDNRIVAHKSVLLRSSEYFKALFNSEMIESKTNEITLKKTLFKPFVTVLKYCYQIVITREEWNLMKIQELFESIITANYYQFIECEKYLSEKIIEIFAYRISDEYVDQYCDSRVSVVANGATSGDSKSMLTIWELLEMSKLHNLLVLNDLCLTFVDENISYAFKTFDRQFVSADVVYDVISRETFGAKEIDIFKLVKSWIRKNRLRNNLKCIEETLLLNCVRLPLISLEDISYFVHKSGLYESEFVENAVKHELNGDLAQNWRTCFESEKLFTTSMSNDVYLRTDDNNVSVCITFMLLMPTKINHIMFQIKPLRDYWGFGANYWIGIPDVNIESGFRKIVDYRQHSCVGEQDLYFDSSYVVNSLRICVEAESLFPDPKSFLICSLSYGHTKRPIKLVNGCLCPNENVCYKFGADCRATFLPSHFAEIISNHMLGANEDQFYFGPKQVRNNLLSEHLQKPLPEAEAERTDSTLYYVIRLPQPVFVDCLQFELKLKIDSFSDDSVSAVCRIDVSADYCRDAAIGVWTTVVDKCDVVRSGFYNVTFDMQQVLMLRVYGYRVDSESRVRYPLNICNFKVPADRSSPYWHYGNYMD